MKTRKASMEGRTRTSREERQAGRGWTEDRVGAKTARYNSCLCSRRRFFCLPATVVRIREGGITPTFCDLVLPCAKGRVLECAIRTRMGRARMEQGRCESKHVRRE